ncbi:uncharacterized protein LOC143021406 [Oratosquilla oratoria]|uniref:uncharacterized protein LOC143021406 n=1 Tax=Oratosquilla oratoria TaxID=337810 RepID=UPI003F766EDF
MVAALQIFLPVLLLLLAANGCVVEARSAGGIVHYQSEASSRNEEGTPGRRVTGEWSWIDATGKKHRVWYIADEGGFRAFGDVMPKEPSTLRVGTPVIGSSALPTEQRDSPSTYTHRYTSTFGPFTGTTGSLIVPPSALRILPPETSQGKKPSERTGTPSRPPQEATTQPPSVQTPPGVLKDAHEPPKLDLPVAKETPRFQIAPRFGKSFTTFRNDDDSRDSHENRSPKPQALRQREDHGLPVFPSKIEPQIPKQSQEDLPRLGVGMAKMVRGDSAEQQFADLPATTPSPVGVGLNENLDLLQPRFPTLEVPRRIQGTEFILVEKMQVPNLPKERIMVIDRLRPKPVVVSGPPPPVISGIHTSGRPVPLDDRSNELPIIRPAGIDLVALGLRPEPVINRDGSDPNGPVPQPKKVEGAINLTNFLSPFLDKARATPPPFDFDYYYYDFYDYLDENRNIDKGPSQSKSFSSEKKSQSKDSDESVDFDDSGEE